MRGKGDGWDMLGWMSGSSSGKSDDASGYGVGYGQRTQGYGQQGYGQQGYGQRGSTPMRSWDGDWPTLENNQMQLTSGGPDLEEARTQAADCGCARLHLVAARS